MKQIITINPLNPITPNSQFNFDAEYSTDPENTLTTGLQLRLHYNSSEVNVSVENVLAAGSSGDTQDLPDADNFDNDSSTDRFINALWFDISGNWPGDGNIPTTLYNVQVETLEAFDGTTFKFTGEPASGFELEASPVSVALNESPVAENDEGGDFTTDEDTAFTTGNVLDNDSDPNDRDTLSISAINTENTQGEVTDNGDGTFEYNPNGQFENLAVGETATDSFTYTVTDGNGGTDTATVTVTIEEEGADLTYDITGDGGIQSGFDGALLFRYSLGLEGEDLTQGLPFNLLDDPTRTAPSEIQSFLDDFSVG